MSIFEKASRLKVKFDTSKGPLSVEDLWDLPLSSAANKPNLDDIAKAINKQLKSADEVSFVAPSLPKNDLLQLKFDLVKHIIDVRIAENAAISKARESAEKKQRLLELINRKEDQVLESKSLDELRKMAEAI